MNNLETKIGDSVTKIDASPLVCQACGAELVTDFISEIQSARVLVRCGGCGVIIGSGIDENAPVDKRARWSLWLGISSVLLLFLTGIPAVYLEIRSLLRMRYTSFRLQDRYAAIAGTTLGSIFGVCGGFCGVFSLVVALALFFSQKTTFNFEQSMVVLSGIAKVEMPEGINQGVAVSAVNTHQFHFRDAKKKEDATCRIQLVYYPPVMVGGAATLKPTLRLNQINNDARYKTLGETQLNWEIAGKATKRFQIQDGRDIQRRLR